jgi:enamine deaminase RidA (YjgF/YER057c/UK114 family)
MKRRDGPRLERVSGANDDSAAARKAPGSPRRTIAGELQSLVPNRETITNAPTTQTRPEHPAMTPNVNLTVTDKNGRKCVSTGSPWEPIVGYSRAIREGDFIFVTGTLGLEPDGRFGPTLKDQTRRALEIIVAAIEALGGKTSDVVRTRIYVTDISRWREAADVHSEYFESIRPATTMVQIVKLIDDEAMVEIEADAVVRHKPQEGVPHHPATH